jgi:metal-responsive CopG/Arc/MetJ family transcriptional regulator
MVAMKATQPGTGAQRRARKATFSLQCEVLAALDEVVAQGAAPSKNAFVERAVRRELQAFKREQRSQLWQEALRDPLFLRDLEETEEAFRTADAESAHRMV